MAAAESYILFTDGASRQNPGPAGWGAILIAGNQVLEIGAGEKKATNNQMELTAVIKGLEEAYRHEAAVTVYTDSQYSINGIEKWVPGWKRNGWVTTTGAAVSNKILWEKLDTLVSLIKVKASVSFVHVPAHVGLILNERADKIASSFADGLTPLLYEGSLEDYDYRDGINNLDQEITSLKKKKTKSKSKSKKAAYSYVSLVEGKVETHATWAECEARVRGVPYAKFKKAVSKEDEIAIIKQWLG